MYEPSPLRAAVTRLAAAVEDAIDTLENVKLIHAAGRLTSAVDDLAATVEDLNHKLRLRALGRGRRHRLKLKSYGDLP